MRCILLYNVNNLKFMYKSGHQIVRFSELMREFDVEEGTFSGDDCSVRRLSDLQGYFADEAAYEAALEAGDPIVYSVSAFTPSNDEGALHCAIARIEPGRIGCEWYLTKGHFHAWRAAAEFYIGLGGEGVMVLESEHGESQMVYLKANSIIYVPGYTAHRTVNTGDVPLVYLGVYSAAAGHDYGAIAQRNFLKVVVDFDGKNTMIDREVFLETLA